MDTDELKNKIESLVSTNLVYDLTLSFYGLPL